MMEECAKLLYKAGSAHMITRIIIRNLLYKPLGTVLSVLLLLLGVGIISLLMLLRKQAEDKFNNDLKDIDLVVGAKGSPLQLVLSAVYHVDAPTGNILRSDVEKFIHDPFIEQAIPLAYGDSYKAFRIVGTDSNYLLKYNAFFKEGRIFRTTLEAVVGSHVASVTKLKTGDRFLGTHGLGIAGQVHQDFQYLVVGILAETNTVLDNLLLTNIETVWKIHEHHDEGNEKQDLHNKELGSIPENEITALLIKFRSPMGIMTLPRIINETTQMQSASPVLEISRMFSLLGVGVTALNAIAFSIMLISGLSVFVSLYNRLQDRKYELALARSLGSSRTRLFFMILSEGLILTIGGFALGIMFSRLGLFLLNKFSINYYHFTTNGIGMIKEEGWLFIASIAIGILASFIPALMAFRLNISKTLANE